VQRQSSAAAASASGPAGACSRGRPHLPKAATRLPRPWTPGTPRTPSRRTCTQWTGGPFPVSRRVRPQARPPPVRWSLGGPPCPYKGAAALYPDAQTPPYGRPRCPPATLRPAAASSGRGPTASRIGLSSTFPCIYTI
jgi:hypothetical protein